MFISPKYNLVSVHKNLKKDETQLLVKNQALTYPLKPAEEPTFKAKRIPKKVVNEMLNSPLYWKTLGLTVAAVAAQIWKQLTDAGIKEEDVPIDKLMEQIKISLPKEVVHNQKLEMKGDSVIDVQPIEAQKIEKPKRKYNKKASIEAPKQKVEKKVVESIKEKKAKRIELIKNLASENYSKTEISEMTGIDLSTVSSICKTEKIETSKVRKNSKGRNYIRITDDIVLKVLELSKEKNTREQISKALGISLSTINRILTGKQAMFVEELKELAKKNLTVEEIAEKTGKEPTFIKRFASKYNIEINIPTEEKIKSIKKKYLYNKNFAVSFNDLKLNPKTQVVIERIKKDYEKELKILKEIDLANSKALFNTITGKKGEVVRYSTEDLFNRYIAKSYNTYLRQCKEERVKKFIEDTTEPRLLLTKESVDFKSVILYSIDEPIPENDELFIQYKNCFNKKQIMSKIFAMKNKYANDLMNEIAQGNLSHVQKLNTDIVITPMMLFNIVRGGKHSVAVLFELLKNANNEKLKEIYRQKIETKSLLKYLHKDKNLEKIAEKIDVSTEEKVEEKSFEEMMNSLESYSEFLQENEELSMRLADFSVFSTEKDKDSLRKFIVILEKISNKELSMEEAILECRSEKIQPADSEIEQYIDKEQKEQVKIRIYNKMNKINWATSTNSSIVLSTLNEICSDNNLKTKPLSYMNDLSKMLDNVDNVIKYRPTEIDRLVEELIFRFFDKKETISNVIEVDKINFDEEFLSKFFNGELTVEDPIKKCLQNFYIENKGTEEEISFEEAVSCLEKIEKYNALTDEEKTHIIKFEQIFNHKTSKVDKKILNLIIEENYLKSDTKIWNNYFGDNVVISSKAKASLYKKHKKDHVLILKDFEKAASVKSKGRETSGVDYQEGSKYSMELRIFGNYGHVRLYSKFLGKKDGKKIQNLCFDIFAKDHK